MKKFLSILIVLLLFFSALPRMNAQSFNFGLQVFEPLPELDLAAFIVNKNLSGTPRIMQITMTPGIDVILELIIWWRPAERSDYYSNPLYRFTTHPFVSRAVLSNNEISQFSDININEDESDEDQIEANRVNGKLTGAYRIIARAYDMNNGVLGSAEAEAIISNPTVSSLIIYEPQANEEVDPNLPLLVKWGGLQMSNSAAVNYQLIGNVRENANQSLEDALNSGIQVIFNNPPSAITELNVQLTEIAARGSEAVLQVKALIDAPGGANEYYSPIVNVKFTSTSTETAGFGNIDNNVIRLLGENLLNELGGGTTGDDEGTTDLTGTENVQRILNMLLNGQITFDQISSMTDENGNTLTQAEVDAILNYLQANPSSIIRMEFIDN